MTTNWRDELKKKGIHKHWVATGDKWMENIVHPISERHNDLFSLRKHRLETGALQRWAKKKGLYLTDSTYDMYNEVLKKELGEKNEAD